MAVTPYRRPTVERTCEACGLTFRVERCRLKCPGKGRFCSRGCAQPFNTRAVTFRNGRDNPRYTHGQSKQGYRYVKTWRIRNPEKVAVQRFMARAFHQGLLMRPGNCERCGKACKPDAHHEDYSKPSEVLWVCRKCHVALNSAWGKGCSQTP